MSVLCWGRLSSDRLFSVVRGNEWCRRGSALHRGSASPASRSKKSVTGGVQVV